MKNFIEEKNRRKKIKSGRKKAGTKKERTHIAEEKSARKFEVHRRKGRRQKTVWTKFNVMIEKSVSPTPSIENPGNSKMPRQFTKCTKTEYRW